jgi:hypothetical protein
MFSEWANKGLNLWTVTQNMFTIIPGQANYPLPFNLVDIVDNEIKVANTIRQLGGTAFAYAGSPPVANGNATNAFDGNPTTACIQTLPNGNIGYDYGALASYPIKYVGIQSNITTTYTLVFEYSFDNSTWYSPYNSQLQPSLNIINPVTQSFTAGQINWYVMPDAVTARYWRIRETGGSTLNVQEIYFDLPTNNSHIIMRLSREEYISTPNLQIQSSVSSFQVNRTLPPTVSLYPTPDASFQYVIYNAIQYIKDVSALQDNYFVPQRFLEATIAGLAYKISVKFAADKAEFLKAASDESFAFAAAEDVERVPLRFIPDYFGGGN